MYVSCCHELLVKFFELLIGYNSNSKGTICINPFQLPFGLLKVDCICPSH